MTAPQTINTSGISWVFQSIIDTVSKINAKVDNGMADKVGVMYVTDANNKPHVNSTSGYCMLILTLHERQRVRKKSQLIIGIKSIIINFFVQDGQKDEGLIMDFLSGRR